MSYFLGNILLIKKWNERKICYDLGIIFFICMINRFYKGGII